MRKYPVDTERTIRVARLVDDWARSGLIERAQRDRLWPELQVDLRRTNRFLRAALFVFGILILAAAVGLVAISLNSEIELGTLCLIAAAGCLLLAEVLVTRLRVYRFGIEEAAAVGAVVLVAIASGLVVSSVDEFLPADFAVFAALIVAAAAALAIYLRFRYVYGAIASMLCGSAAMFQLDLPQVAQRFLAVAVMLGFFVASRMKRHQFGDDFPGDQYGWIQAAAWLGMYGILNVQLTEELFGRVPPSSFYWFTYAMIWALPAVGLWLSLHDRDRPLLDASVAMTLLTVMTNTPYLGAERHPWDPILFGLLLIGTSLVVRRWLAAGHEGARRGFTASRVLLSDQEKIGVVGIASAAVHGPFQQHESPSTETFKTGGGRSGGAGASGSF